MMMRFSANKQAVLLFIVGLLLANPSPAQIGATAVALPESASAYLLGVGDKVRLIVFGEDALGGEFMIGSTGKVALPLIGEIDAGGLTLTEFQARITTALADGYLKAPRVSVEVLNYRPFYILGEVNKPGEYPYVNGLTVMNAVAQAQGFTYRANTKQIRVRHPNGAGEEKIKLTTDTAVAPGDTILVRERWF